MAKVLVVDDVHDNIMLLTYELEDDGFEVLSATSGKDCLRIADQLVPDVILLDIRMPEMGGIETLEHLKKNPRTTDIPVIMVSANDSNDNIISVLDLGAHDFVSKPVEYVVLAARMRSALRLSHALTQLEEANIELNKLATTDPLTNCFNRRHFFSLSRKETLKATRHHRGLSIFMMDIDYFKKVNDTYGHIAGDQALIQFANCCRGVCRESDILGRVGGEEFALSCPDTNIEGAKMLAERLRIACEQLPINVDGKVFNMTISIGVTQFLPTDTSFDSALQRADKLLYKSKEYGRNRCISEGDLLNT